MNNIYYRTTNFTNNVDNKFKNKNDITFAGALYRLAMPTKKHKEDMEIKM